jgi:hypothetical protein
VLYARRNGVLKVKYSISQDRTQLTTWTPPSKGDDGTFVLDGTEYVVDADSSASQALLKVDEGEVVAAAHGLGRTPWFVQAHGRDYTFVRSLERWSEQLMVAGGQQVGVVRKVADKRRRWAEAELPDMHPPVAVFVMAVVLTMWAGSDLTAASALN